MSKNLHTKAMDDLLDGVLSLQTREEAYLFFEDLLAFLSSISPGQESSTKSA